MKEVPSKLGNILRKIKDNTFVVPRFQRDFVWDTAATCKLIDSIARDYPIGALLTLPAEALSLPCTELKWAYAKAVAEAKSRAYCLLYAAATDEHARCPDLRAAMSAAVLWASATMSNAAATLAEEAEQIMSEARAALAVAPLWVKEQRQISWHFEEARDLDNARVPLYHATNRQGCGWARGYYTTDVARVTCKRCLKGLAKKLKKVVQ